MFNTINDAIWDTVLNAVKNLQSKVKEVVFYEGSEELFYENFNFYYKSLVKNFMAEDFDDKTLDRHKVAAVIICSILKTKPVGIGQEFLELCNEKEFLGNEKIAFEVALSYMYEDLSKCFAEGSVPYVSLFPRYVLPIPYSCERKYGEVICRDLYFSNQFYELSPLLLANILFCIEEYSFCFYGIKRKEL